MLLQRELFPTMFYTFNSSPMLVTKSVFNLKFVLSNYQTCTLPLKTDFQLFPADEQGRWFEMLSYSVKNSQERFHVHVRGFIDLVEFL